MGILPPLWFNIAPPDMTSHHRQSLGDVFGYKLQGDGGVFHKAHYSMNNEQLGSRRMSDQNFEIIK